VNERERSQDEKHDALERGFSLLSAQLEQLNEIRLSHVDESWVRDYHAALDILQGIGIDVAIFRVSPSDVTPLEVSSNYMTGRKTYSEKRHIDRYLFKAKLSAVVTYFEVTDGKPRHVLGFRPPKT